MKALLAVCCGALLMLGTQGFRVIALDDEIVRLREEVRTSRQSALADRLTEAEARKAEVDRLRRSLELQMPGVAGPALDALQREILAPSVQVNALGSVGGGTLLASRDGLSFVVTAFHVVSKVVTPESDEETRAPVEVALYRPDGAPIETVVGDLVAWDETRDLALLRLRTLREYPHVARLADRDRLREIRVFTPLYAVGCPLGHDPLPTIGEIATLNKEVRGHRFWMMNAPTIFGNSGGGVFHRETRELIGVSVMVCTYEGAVATPVPHLGVLVSLDQVYDWLDALGLQCVYDPEYPLESYETLRAGLRDVAGGR
jgi:hypothetical protein